MAQKLGSPPVRFECEKGAIIATLILLIAEYLYISRLNGGAEWM